MGEREETEVVQIEKVATRARKTNVGNARISDVLFFIHKNIQTDRVSIAAVASSRNMLPLHLVDVIGGQYAVPWLPPGVCKAWEETRRNWLHALAIRIQAAYRGRRNRYETNEAGPRMSHADVVRMYIVHYPFEYLQRWPDLARRKCPHLTEAQHQRLSTLPLAEQRTRRDVRDVLCVLTAAQIRYVGW